MQVAVELPDLFERRDHLTQPGTADALYFGQVEHKLLGTVDRAARCVPERRGLDAVDASRCFRAVLRGASLKWFRAASDRSRIG